LLFWQLELAIIRRDIHNKLLALFRYYDSLYNTESILTYLEKLEEYQIPTFMISNDIRKVYENSELVYYYEKGSNLH
jgi:hypothetical protein